MIVLFTDFGAADIYVAQVKAALLTHLTRRTEILDLLHDAPSYDARAGAHLLAALQGHFPPGTVFFAVVDPGVGGERDAAVLQADDRWFVGPDNGLLSVVAARAVRTRTWRIAWRPQSLSASFHGRDLFAPMAAWIVEAAFPADKLVETIGLQVRMGQEDLPQIIHIDHYGNAITGLRAQAAPDDLRLRAGGRELMRGRVFADAPEGFPFWYVNSIGLIEIAASRASAAALLGLKVGDPVHL